MKVSVFGLGYVGCVTAGCLSHDGHDVVGVDVVASKVRRLGAGRPTVVEPGLEGLITEGHRGGRIATTLNAAEAVRATEVSLICVGTPNLPDGSLDVCAVKATAETIGAALRDKRAGHLVVLRSTVPVGTTESIVQKAILPRSHREVVRGHRVVIVPEFLREGSAVADYADPPLVVVGAGEEGPGEHQAILRELFEKGSARIRWTRYREAEMLKALCNAFHGLKVAFANEAGALCTRLSVDGHVVMGLLAEDRKLNASAAYLRPGLPFGGSCLPKDLRMLTSLGGRTGTSLPLLAAVMPSNQSHLGRLIDAIHVHGRRRVGLEGLSFKARTDDLRESPMVLVAENLIGKGYDLKIYDPDVELSRVSGANREYIEEHIPHLSSRLVSSMDKLLEHSELLVLTRDDDALMSRAAQLGVSPIVVDLTAKNRTIGGRPRAAARRRKPQLIRATG